MSEVQNGGKKMERLTNKAWRNFDPWECCGQDKYCQRGCHDPGGCTKGCIVPQLYARLGAYEDTELTPEEINDLASAREISPEAEYAINKHADSIIERFDKLLTQTDDDARLRELVKADRAGRLVVLPCKVGDTVWAASGKIIKCEIDEMCLCDGGGIEYLVTFDCDGADCKGCPFNRWEQDCSGECYCDCEYGNGSFKDSDIGKTIFLTSEKAKAALEAMKEEC